MRYSQEFKDNVVARLLSKELSISGVCRFLCLARVYG